MTGFTPGDIIVSQLTVSSDRGSLDLTSSFVRASVYESIFTPGIIADIFVLDTDDQVGNLKIVGDEVVQFTFRAPGGQEANFTFALHSLENSKSTPAATKSKTYELRCVSEEILQECIRKQKEEDEQPGQPHSATCGWHKDWHDCSCGAFDRKEESK